MSTGSHGDQVCALRQLLEAIGDKQHAPLIGTDFADVVLRQVPCEFVQDSNGVHFSFVVSNHALGKVLHNQELADALSLLLQDEGTYDAS